MFRWDPDQYLRYAAQRGRPFADLVAQIGAAAPGRVLDLGCGDGGFTATLRRRWPAARILGVDASAEMIAAASVHTSHADEQLSFALGDVATLAPSAEFDVVLSNAVFQWVPTHASVLQAWAAVLRPGSWLGFQVPANFDAPAHTLLRSLATSARWADRLPPDLLRHHDAVLAPVEYAQLLLAAGWVAEAWETTYTHILPGDDAVLDWMRGTGLRPVLNVLSTADAEQFATEYGRLLARAYPATDYGTFLPYRRIFCVAHRPS